MANANGMNAMYFTVTLGRRALFSEDLMAFVAKPSRTTCIPRHLARVYLWPAALEREMVP